MNTHHDMIVRPERALRFFGNDSRPGLAASASGALQMVEEADAVRQSLMTLLSTRPGERVMRPNYGCDLDSLVFAATGPTLQVLAELLIDKAIARFEPRVEHVEISAMSDPDDPARLFITIDYAIRRRQRRDRIAIVVPTLQTPEVS